MKQLIAILVLIFLIGCATPFSREMDIADTQSKLVTLSFQCENGDKIACDRIPIVKLELHELIGH